MKKQELQNTRKFLKMCFFEFFTEEYGTLKEYVYGVEVDNDVNIQLSHKHTEMKWCRIDEALELLKYDTNKEAFKKLYKLIK